MIDEMSRIFRRSISIITLVVVLVIIVETGRRPQCRCATVAVVVVTVTVVVPVRRRRRCARSRSSPVEVGVVRIDRCGLLLLLYLRRFPLDWNRIRCIVLLPRCRRRNININITRRRRVPVRRPQTTTLVTVENSVLQEETPPSLLLLLLRRVPVVVVIRGVPAGPAVAVAVPTPARVGDDDGRWLLLLLLHVRSMTSLSSRMVVRSFVAGSSYESVPVESRTLTIPIERLTSS